MQRMLIRLHTFDPTFYLSHFDKRKGQNYEGFLSAAQSRSNLLELKRKEAHTNVK